MGLGESSDDAAPEVCACSLEIVDGGANAKPAMIAGKIIEAKTTGARFFARDNTMSRQSMRCLNNALDSDSQPGTPDWQLFRAT